MRKILIFSVSTLLISLGAGNALAFDWAVSPGLSINSTSSTTPTLRAGGGEFYPVMSYLSVNGDLDLNNLTLANSDGATMPIDSTSGKNVISGEIKYTKEMTLSGAYNGFAVPIPIILEGPMNVGHINFDLGEVTLDANDKAILRAVAKEMMDTNLTAAYLVGRADHSGNEDLNFIISEKRVQAAKAYLKSYLTLLGVTNAWITTEYMGELTAKGSDTKPNAEDRRVDITIFPNL